MLSDGEEECNFPIVIVAAQTDRGLCRDRNEDSFLAQPSRGLFAVADGMGGLPMGAVASRMAVDGLADAADAELSDLTAFVAGLNERIRAEGLRKTGGTIGTTLTLAHVVGTRLCIAHVGDSAAFLLTPGIAVLKLTREHTEAEERRRSGHHTLPVHEHILTRCLGQEESLAVDVAEFDFPLGARLALCTDGITKTLDKVVIARLLTKYATPQEVAEHLVRAANENGGPDNATAVVVFNL